MKLGGRDWLDAALVIGEGQSPELEVVDALRTVEVVVAWIRGEPMRTGRPMGLQIGEHLKVRLENSRTPFVRTYRTVRP